MYSTVWSEMVFFFFSFAAGVCAAFLYDILRVSRRIHRPTDAVVNIEDILFMTLAGVLLFVAAYLRNSGEIRWQGFIGWGIGAVSYALIVKNKLLNAGTFLVKWMVEITRRVLKILLFPISLIMKALKRPIHIVMWYTGQKIRRAKQVAKISSDKARLRMKKARIMLRKK
ncbi:MAG: spore cortex biosynthesis protein YabQ [Clostridia bacterium]|nr:spore cortex biosynthesis protein YabQ [Clostridia bacterium]